MKAIIFITIGLYIMYLSFDIMYISTHIKSFGIIAKVSLVLACAGSIYYAIKTIRNRKD